jgi:hypothetical protein
LAAIDALAGPDHNRAVTTAQRIAGALLTIAVLVASAATRLSDAPSRHHHSTHGCQAAAPAGAAAIEAVDVGGVTQHAASAAGVSNRGVSPLTPAASTSSRHFGFTFARPHDPGHLHAFALLI